MLDKMIDPYDMLQQAHQRIDYLETIINNERIEIARLKNQIQVLLNAVQVLQNSQISMLDHMDELNLR